MDQESTEERKIKRTARVRRGLRRAVMVLRADEESIRGEYRHHGMTKADLDDYQQAIQWIDQQSSDKK